MSEELNREILDELKIINQKLDIISEQRGISTPLKFFAVIIGLVHCRSSYYVGYWNDK
jgi:hypothetical protein